MILFRLRHRCIAGSVFGFRLKRLDSGVRVDISKVLVGL